MALSRPPAYAWDWFARQRLLWREARATLALSATTVAARYELVATKAQVLPLLRADYPRDAIVRDVVHRTVADVAFLGRTDVPFAQLSIPNAPRGMRWWWSAVTGEDLATPDARRAPPRPPAQISLDEVNQSYGD